jgi:hypothetical protein
MSQVKHPDLGRNIDAVQREDEKKLLDVTADADACRLYSTGSTEEGAYKHKQDPCIHVNTPVFRLRPWAGPGSAG